MPISVSEKAATEFTALLGREGKTGASLRVWVAGMGCSGFRYEMGFEESEPEEGDRVFESNGIKVVVDSQSMEYMDGAKVDYIDDPENGGFSVDNPNRPPEMGCDCGSSGCGEHTSDGQAGEE
jgi:iron-sulfur cluster assembly protein